MTNWQDRIVGVRMQVDDEFEDRVEQSSFSRQQWGLVMTAVDFDIENPGDEDAAHIVADTSKLSSVMPELDNVQQQMASMGAGGSGSQSGSSGGGLFGKVKSALGLGGGSGGGGDDEREAEAAQLAEEYAELLQERLEESGRWDEVRRVAAEDP